MDLIRNSNKFEYCSKLPEDAKIGPLSGELSEGRHLKHDLTGPSNWLFDVPPLAGDADFSWARWGFPASQQCPGGNNLECIGTSIELVVQPQPRRRLAGIEDRQDSRRERNRPSGHDRDLAAARMSRGPVQDGK